MIISDAYLNGILLNPQIHKLTDILSEAISLTVFSDTLYIIENCTLFFSSMVIRDLTLRSAASFGSFHLIRLLYDEYMFYLIEHQVAEATGVVPIAVILEGIVSHNFIQIYYWKKHIIEMYSVFLPIRIFNDNF